MNEFDMGFNPLKNKRKTRIADSRTARRHRTVTKAICTVRKVPRKDGRRELSPYELKAAKAPPPCILDGYVGGEEMAAAIEARFFKRQPMKPVPVEAEAAEYVVPTIGNFCFDEMAPKLGLTAKRPKRQRRTDVTGTPAVGLEVRPGQRLQNLQQEEALRARWGASGRGGSRFEGTLQ